MQENFDPAVGFVSRRGYRQYSPAVEFGPRPANHRYIRQVNFGGSLDTLTDLHNDLLKRNDRLPAGPAAIAFAGQFQAHDHPPVRAPRCAIRDHARDHAAAGRRVYVQSRIGCSLSTANRRGAVGQRVGTSSGEFYSGTRAEQQVNLNVRARPGLFLFLTAQWNDVELPEGHFTTRLYRLVGETQFTPFIALMNNIQYDSQSAVLGWQSRFRWIVTPGNDLYVVYTHNWLDDPLLRSLRHARQAPRVESPLHVPLLMHRPFDRSPAW